MPIPWTALHVPLLDIVRQLMIQGWTRGVCESHTLPIEDDAKTMHFENAVKRKSYFFMFTQF